MKFIKIKGHTINLSLVTNYWAYVHTQGSYSATGVRFEFQNKNVDIKGATKEEVDELVNPTSDFSKEKVESLQAQVKDLISSEVTADAEIERLRSQIQMLEETYSGVSSTKRGNPEPETKPVYGSHATDEARAKGCCCPPLKGTGHFDGVSYYCPLHGR